MGALIIGGASGYIARRHNEGLDRACRFWTSVLPIYCHYRLTQIRYRDTDNKQYRYELQKLHERYADDALDVVLSLRGLFIKIGQLASMRDDAMPEEYLKRFRRLQYDVPAAPLSYVKNVIESELNIHSYDQVFSYIDPIPLGAASIGQCHAATLRGSDREVCVKIQYPEVESLFQWDFSVIKAFCQLAMPEHLPFLGEVEKQFLTEFNFRMEAANLLEVRKNMQKANFASHVVVPKPMQHLCTKRVLVMERLHGTPIITIFRDRMREMAKEQGSTLEDFESEVRKSGAIPLEVQSIQFAFNSVWWSDAVLNILRSFWNFTGGWVFGHPQLLWKWRTVDIKKIHELIWQVHAHQMLIDGCFNADPHPGNILMLEDGRIGLIDYGQTKRIDSATRKGLARLIVALCEDDKDAIVAATVANGLRTRDMDPWVLEMHSRIAFDNQDQDTTLRGLDIQSFAHLLDSRDPVISSDDELVMCTRCVMMLMGLSYGLGAKHRICKLLETTAREVLTD